MSEEIRVVIALRGGRGSIGVGAPNCDPVFVIVEGDLETALERVAGLVEEARQRWASSPQYPKCEFPLPSQTQTLSQTARPAQRQPTAPTAPRMF